MEETSLLYIILPPAPIDRKIIACIFKKKSSFFSRWLPSDLVSHNDRRARGKKEKEQVEILVFFPRKNDIDN